MALTDPLPAVAPLSEITVPRRHRYGRAAGAVHWITFVLPVAVVALGLLQNVWPDHSTQSYWINAGLGLLQWCLTMGRLYSTLARTPPAPPSARVKLARRLSWPVQLALYVPVLVQAKFGIVHPMVDLHGELAQTLLRLPSYLCPARSGTRASP